MVLRLYRLTHNINNTNNSDNNNNSSNSDNNNNSSTEDKTKEEKIMFRVMMMTKREEGYRVVAYANTVEAVKEKVRALKIYYSPIDVYYCYN